MTKSTIIILFLGLSVFSNAQQTNFRGLVLDKFSNDTLAFVPIQGTGSKVVD